MHEKARSVGWLVMVSGRPKKPPVLERTVDINHANKVSNGRDTRSEMVSVQNAFLGNDILHFQFLVSKENYLNVR